MVEPQASQVETAPRTYTPPDAVAKSRRRASVRLATWLSTIPGLGQLYNRQPKKAGIFLLLVVGLFAFTLNIPGATEALLLLWKPRGSTMVLLSLLVQMLSLLVFMTTFLLALVFWYDAMHDARRTAQERNGERQPGGRWWWFHR
jgi:arabinogalactan oligomer / maltooligosaccharide transport system permease protein